MSDCIFCNIIAGELPSTPVYQDEDVLVIPDIHPQAPVHLLIVTKKHVPEFLDADEPLVAKVFAIAKKMIHDEKITNYRLVNNGKGAAFIDHLHVHVMGKVDKFRKL